MKALLLFVLGIVGLLLGVVLPLALTGNLNAEAVSRLIGTQKDSPEAAASTGSSTLNAPPLDASSELAQQLMKKERDLQDKEKQLAEREAKITEREQALQEMLSKLESLQKEIEGGLANADKERELRVKTVALTLAQMKPEKAAASLKNFAPQEAAAVLAQVKDKDRGKILEAMDPETAAGVLRALQEQKAPSL